MQRFQGRYRTDSPRLRGHDYAAPGWYFVTICTKGRAYFFGQVRGGVMGLSPAGCIAAQEWQRTPQVRPSVRLDAFVVMPNHVHGLIGLMPRDGDGDDGDENGDPGGNGDADGNGDDDGRNGGAHGGNVDDDGRNGGAHGGNVAVETLRRNVSTGRGDHTETRDDHTETRDDHTGTDGSNTKNERMAAISPDAGSLPVIVRAYKSIVTRRLRRAACPDFAWQSRFWDRVVRDEAERRRGPLRVMPLRCIRRYIQANPRRWTRDRNHPER